MDESELETSVSGKFSCDDADITLRSSDAILFEIVDVSEASTILELLLQFMSRQPQPALETLDFNTLVSLAEAVEKYRVYVAMPICRVYMEKAICDDQAVKILNYAVKHDYLDVADEAAHASISQSPKEIMIESTLECFKAWIQYHQRWLDVLQNAHSFQTLDSKCDVCVRNLARILQRLGLRPSSLRNLDFVFKINRP